MLRWFISKRRALSVGSKRSVFGGGGRGGEGQRLEQEDMSGVNAVGS